MTIYQMPFTQIQSLPGLKLVEARLKELSRSTDKWTTLFSQNVTGGGKRLRPALVLLCGSFAPASQTELIDVACAAELIHTASLVHDDIIDHAATRRGVPTVSGKWGNQQAVLYGDFLFTKAFSLLTRHGLIHILESMTRAISLMCEGEITQAHKLYDCKLTEAEYTAYIHKKTAYFLSACCLAGAQVSELPHHQARNLAAFGLQLGYAFQITDDLLDYAGHADSTGKPVLHDLREGYITLPIIKLLRNPTFGMQIRRIIEERDFNAGQFEFICHALAQSGILRETQEKARTLISRAKSNLNNLPVVPARMILTRLADYILQRTC